MKDNRIDYSKLNEQIVRQAYAVKFVLDEQEKHKLIEGKFERAKKYYEALQKSPIVY
jgi:hypothetical protein